MRLNKTATSHRTHAGSQSLKLKPIEELTRSVMACLLWENSFYENGESIAVRIRELVHRCSPSDVMELALRARNEMHLRHVPLLLIRELARHPKKPQIAPVLSQVIQRADELAEFLALYWMEGRSPLSKQVKKGLADAFCKFDQYQLSKYNRNNEIRLRDVLFLVHPKPRSEEQAQIWEQLANDTLPPADTWEVALSSGKDKKEVFTRLMMEGKLGYMALLRNLRNMYESGVSEDLVQKRLLEGALTAKALPFRFIAAARAVPQWEPMIDQAMQSSMRNMADLPGKTALLIDVSGSMRDPLSKRSDLTRMDAACALAILVRGLCQYVRVFTFSDKVQEVPARYGMALSDVIVTSQPHRSTHLGAALEKVKDTIPGADRIIVVTDEQSHDHVGGPGNAKGYMINVASYENGVANHEWVKINGFSESIIRYIQAVEAFEAAS